MTPGAMRPMEGFIGAPQAPPPTVSVSAGGDKRESSAAAMLLMLEGHGRRQSASRTPDRSPPRTPSVSVPPIQSWPDSAGVIAASPHAFSGAGPAVAAATLNSGSAGSGGHTCPYCNKTFVSQSKVKRHFLVHTKDKPFHCNTCGTRFTQKSALKVHVQKKHGEHFDEAAFKRDADSQSLEWQRQAQMGIQPPASGVLQPGVGGVVPMQAPMSSQYMPVQVQSNGTGAAPMMFYQMVPVMPVPVHHQNSARPTSVANSASTSAPATSHK